MLCADGYTRHCYPIIAGFMVDYEEQVLITGVKSGRHCSICQVPPDERENLDKSWDLRTHEYTRAQIRAQLAQSEQSDAQGRGRHKTDMDVHIVRNFAWKHAFVNIHTTMMVDILHQLLKGIVMRLIEWVGDLMKDLIPNQYQTKKRKLNRRNANASYVV